MSMLDPKMLKFMDDISEKIRDAEDELSSADFLDASYGVLSWEHHGGRHRIMLRDKPLADYGVRGRLRGFKDLDGLVDVVLSKAVVLVHEVAP